jgi:putative flavoprotein involved in K+ transport
LLGSAGTYENGLLHFKPDLAKNIARGDANYLSVLDAADAYIAQKGLDLPEEPKAREIAPDPQCMSNPAVRVEPRGAGIASIIWATGYALDFDWLKVDTLR